MFNYIFILCILLILFIFTMEYVDKLVIEYIMREIKEFIRETVATIKSSYVVRMLLVD